MLSIVAYILLAIGGLGAVVGGLWFLIVAFKESPLWGIGTILIPFVSLIFLIKFWSDAWKPFAVQMVGFLIGGVGAALVIPAMADDIATSAIAYEESYSEDAYGDEYDEYDEYSDDEYGDEYSDDEYAEDDVYSEDGNAEDDTTVAETDVEAGEDPDSDSAGDVAQDPQVADASPVASSAPALPAATSTTSPRRATTPPARLGGSFARSSDDSSIPMEFAADYIGERIKITKSSGNVVYCRLLDVTEDSLTIHQSIGGGMVRFTLPKDSIQRIAKDTRR